MAKGYSARRGFSNGAGQAAQQMQIFAVIDDQILARSGCETFFAAAHAAFFLSRAGGLAEIGRRTSHVVDISLEIFLLGHVDRFFQN